MVNLLADFVVRFNIAARRNAEFFYVPYSAINFKIVKLLLSYGCISTFGYDTHPFTKTLRIKISPSFLENKPLIRGLELISKPGLRVYWGSKELSKNFFFNNFQGFYIVSTTSGLCSSNELLLTNKLMAPIGGEILIKVNL